MSIRMDMVVFLLVVGSACDRPSGEVVVGQSRDSAGIAVVEHGAEAPRTEWRLDSAPLLEIGGASDEGPDLFRVVAAVRLGDGRIIVAEGNPPRLLAFDSDGSHLRTTGQRGAGPGEFESIGWLQRLADDSLLVFDPRLRRASIFTDSLRFVSSLTPERPQVGTGGIPTLVGAFADRSLLSTSQRMAPPPAAGGMVRPRLVLFSHDAGGAIGDSLATIQGDEVAVVQGIIARPPFAKRTKIAVGTERFVVAMGDEFAVQEYGRDGNLRAIYRREGDLIPVSEDDVARYRLGGELGLRGALTYPAIEALLLDDVGNLWVNEFRKEVAESSNWVVFGPDGELVADLRLDPAFRLLHVSERLALGTWHDELGVESMRLYRLLTGAPH